MLDSIEKCNPFHSAMACHRFTGDRLGMFRWEGPWGSSKSRPKQYKHPQRDQKDTYGVWHALGTRPGELVFNICLIVSIFLVVFNRF